MRSRFKEMESVVLRGLFEAMCRNSTSAGSCIGTAPTSTRVVSARSTNEGAVDTTRKFQLGSSGASQRAFDASDQSQSSRSSTFLDAFSTSLGKSCSRRCSYEHSTDDNLVAHRRSGKDIVEGLLPTICSF